MCGNSSLCVFVCFYYKLVLSGNCFFRPPQVPWVVEASLQNDFGFALQERVRVQAPFCLHVSEIHSIYLEPHLHLVFKFLISHG